jgi:glycosyltransferase involved in cell wall biosynthesis
LSYVLSIIIPTLNSESTISNCLESLSEQKFKEFDVFIMDGLSSDNTLAIVKSFYLKFGKDRLNIISEKDKGVYEAMNKGINKSFGDWLYFLGSDDIIVDSDVLADIFLIKPIPKADLIYGNALFLHNRMVYDHRFSLRKILFKGNICHQAIFYKRTVFEKVGLYDTRYIIYADYDMNIKCFEDEHLIKKYINRIICIYNEREGMTGRNTPDRLFHDKREEYRDKYDNSLKGKFRPIVEKWDMLIEKIKFKITGT